MKKSWTMVRCLTAFWIFGLCNNFAYVIMLSAAEDILARQEHKSEAKVNVSCEEIIESRECKSITTGAVLLADILPCLVVKLTFPFFMQRIPFGIRVFTVCLLQAASYIVTAFSAGVGMSLFGVGLASVGSGLGEITFLSMIPFFNRNAISTWSSGTGGAGVIGSFAYAALTEPHIANLTPKNALLIMLIVPILFAFGYWCLLVVPKSVHKVNLSKPKSYIVPYHKPKISSDEVDSCSPTENDSGTNNDHEDLLQRRLTMKEKLRIIPPLLKFIIPLSLVYIGEYVINQGIVQLIFFDCSHGFNLSKSSQYRWYQVIYQIGVFFSRSSINLIQLPYWVLVLLPILQLSNTVIFFLDALYLYIPHIWILFLLILFEGLFGGSSYVNTFFHIHNFAAPDVREYSMAVGGVSDSLGVVLAGFASIPIHNFVCSKRIS